MADDIHHLDKTQYSVPFVCGCRNLGEALRRIVEGASMLRTKGEAGTGNIVEAVRHARTVQGEIKRLASLSKDELYVAAKELRAPYELVKEVAENGKLPVVDFAAGGVATPADAALMMQLGMDGVFVGSGIFKSHNPEARARAIVQAVTHYRDKIKCANRYSCIIPFAVAVPEYKQINHGRTGDPVPCSWLPDNPELVGRTSELEKLKSAVTAGTMTALLGIAGVGKSHTAKRFAWSWVSETDTNKTRFALWLSSETEASIRLGYDRVMEQLNITPNTDEGFLATSEMARRVWDKLRQLPFEWLVVFDNAPEAANGVEGPKWIQPWFFPTPITGWGSGGRILFTTRSNSYRGQTCLGRVSPIRVNPLNETDGVDLLLRDIMDDGASEALFAESR